MRRADLFTRIPIRRRKARYRSAARDKPEEESHDDRTRQRAAALDRGEPPARAPRRAAGRRPLPPPRRSAGAGPGRRPRPRRGRPALRRRAAACRSTASPPVASAAPSSTPSAPSTGRPARSGPSAAHLEAVEQELANSNGAPPIAGAVAAAMGVTDRRARRHPRPGVPLGRARPRARRRPGRRRRREISPRRRPRRPHRRRAGRGPRGPRAARATCATPSSLLPERHRIVVVGYFLEERTSARARRRARRHRVPDLPDPQRGARHAPRRHRRPVRARPTRWSPARQPRRPSPGRLRRRRSARRAPWRERLVAGLTDS